MIYSFIRVGESPCATQHMDGGGNFVGRPFGGEVTLSVLPQLISKLIDENATKHRLAVFTWCELLAWGESLCCQATAVLLCCHTMMQSTPT